MPWLDGPGNSTPDGKAAVTHTPLVDRYNTQVRDRQPRMLQSGQIRRVSTCGRFRQEAQVSLSEAAAVLGRQLVDLRTDSLHRVLGHGRHMRTTLLPEVLQTVLETHRRTSSAVLPGGTSGGEGQVKVRGCERCRSSYHVVLLACRVVSAQPAHGVLSVPLHHLSALRTRIPAEVRGQRSRRPQKGRGL